MYGLRSLAIMTTAWLVVSMVAGPVLGLLGQLSKTRPVPGAALAAGVACGLLSSEGWQGTTTAPPWRLLAAAVSSDAGYVRGFAAAALAEFLVPFAVLAWLATAHRLWRAWPIMIIAMILTAASGALFWHLLRTAANHVG